jgi:molybdopterin-containing oxidoreductase family membrane subunit
VWIEKGMGLIIPAFVPSTLHELIEYVPTLSEWKITAGVWAVGAMVLTVLVKISLPVLRGELGPESIRPKAKSNPPT